MEREKRKRSEEGKLSKINQFHGGEKSSPSGVDTGSRRIRKTEAGYMQYENRTV